MPRNTQNNRGGGNGRRSNNNNPEGYNQYNSGWMDSARERPIAAAGLAAAAVGASVFLWSRRNQISEQLSNLSDQIGDWSENFGSRSGSDEFEMAGTESRFGASSASGSSSGFGDSGLSGSDSPVSPASGSQFGSTTAATGATGGTAGKRGGATTSGRSGS